MEKKMNIAERVRQAVEEIINQAGYSVWDVTLYKEGSESVLEISIDRTGGISIDDCSVVTKLIDPIIDELDPIAGSYVLEVSSAGLYRTLRSEQHFIAATGKEATIKLFTALENKKEYGGIISCCDKNTINLIIDGVEKSFDKKLVSKAEAVFKEI